MAFFVKPICSCRTNKTALQPLFLECYSLTQYSKWACTFDTMGVQCLIPIWIVVYRRQGLYLHLCIYRILPGGVIFSQDIKYTCIKILARTSLRRVNLTTW